MVQDSRRVRDSQRIRVYRANSAVLGAAVPEMDDVRMLCHSVVNSDVYKNLFPSPDVHRVPTLKPGRGARTAHVLWHFNGKIEIVFPRAYRYTTYVLHELTHYGLGPNESIAAHGPEFVGAFLTLTRTFCSSRTTQALERAFAREKVKFHIPIISTVQNSKSKCEPEFLYDPDTNTVIVNSCATHIDQLQLFG